MNRRQFVVCSGAAGLAAARGVTSAAVNNEPVLNQDLMKLVDQTTPTNDVHLKCHDRYGVQNICA